MKDIWRNQIRESFDFKGTGIKLVFRKGKNKMTRLDDVSFIGGGSFGTALAIMLATKGYNKNSIWA